MMELGVREWLLCAGLLFAVCPALSTVTEVHFTEGGELVLRPAAAPQHISAIQWTFNRDVVAEWIKDKIPSSVFDPFSERAELDLDTGELRIHNATRADVGRFVVEINRYQQEVEFDSKLLSVLSKPWVIVRPVSCSSSSPSCTLTCHLDGKLKDLGPLLYSWRINDESWMEEKESKDLLVHNTPTERQSYSCRVKNPLSQQDSEPYSDVFKPEQQPSSAGLIAGVFFGVIFGVLIILGIIALLIGYFTKWEPIRRIVDYFGRPTGDPQVQSANGTAASPGEMQSLNPPPTDGVREEEEEEEGPTA